ncbi:GntR family transcriptional regulator [Pseudonocardia acaciae]|uniref:GntR family transcriptional regulator n=1 Tax=Pseudonocardia acaciae TaxID=551276 RepID=UPI0006870AED|nr:GntR family transcriptional regulator [Pseudonocardia acaciae]
MTDQVRQTARDVAAARVRALILDGTFAPGHKLNAADLAVELGVSQTPAREALQLLASEGLVKISAYRGAFVADLSAGEYEEIFLMRIGLEQLAAKLGAELIDDDGIMEARRFFKELESAASSGDTDRFVQADRAFHKVHYLASQRTSLWERIASLRAAAERYIRIGYNLPSVDMKDTVRRHRGLLLAIEERDGDLAKAIIGTDLTRTFNAVHQELLDRNCADQSGRRATT